MGTKMITFSNFLLCMVRERSSGTGRLVPSGNEVIYPCTLGGLHLLVSSREGVRGYHLVPEKGSHM